MILPPILASARHYVSQALAPGGIAIDATVGNGHDTLFLAELAGKDGHVYGFDIQPAALAATRERLTKADQIAQVTLIEASHHLMAEHLPFEATGRVQAVMFNLGYLPHGDPAIITRPETTLQALETASNWLANGGIISVALYTGHPGGDSEAQAVIRWAGSLPAKTFRVMWQQVVNRQQAPSLLLIEKS